ncbi:hypothetical protein U9M48_033578 [Paspalum notatum var. saurae]|uniref:Reverse transcriptase zinc-binding domain-containing protein n=1 Tax=Paspalum notatum var. saurae TaxID=547442 RepID=A0AAQ3UAF1_PASNO
MEYGGLGITDLSLLGLALRVRWSWFHRTDPDRVWTDLEDHNERVVRDLFRAGTEVILGDGSSALFWLDNWLDGAAIEVVAPNLFAAVPQRFHRRTVAEGLQDRAWIRDIKKQLTMPAISEYVDIWERTQGIELVDRPDSFRWRWEADSHYSAASAYRSCFLGSSRMAGAKIIWRARVPQRVKFFAWLALLALQHNKHNIVAGLVSGVGGIGCRRQMTVLFAIRRLNQWNTSWPDARWLQRLPPYDLPFIDWWTRERKFFSKLQRRGFDELILLVIWLVWKERNDRIFRRMATRPVALVVKMVQEAKLWALAGHGVPVELARAAEAAAAGSPFPSASPRRRCRLVLLCAASPRPLRAAAAGAPAPAALLPPARRPRSPATAALLLPVQRPSQADGLAPARPQWRPRRWPALAPGRAAAAGVAGAVVHERGAVWTLEHENG